MTVATLERMYPGCYRVRNGSDRFGQIKKVGHLWQVQIRDTRTGDMVRQAGMWDTKKDAVSEVEFILGASR